MNRIKKDDMVAIRTGKDKNKVGKVLLVNPKKNAVIVEGINIRTHFNKPKGMMPGSMTKKEGIVHISNVSLMNPDIYKEGMESISSLKDCVKVSYKLVASGKKVRVARSTGKEISF